MSTHTIDTDDMTVTLFEGTSYAKTFPLGDVHNDVQPMLALYGLKQKLVDGAAKEKGTSIDDKIDAVLERWSALQSGQWNLRRAGTGPRISDLVRAIAEVMEIDEEEAKEKVAKLTDEEKKEVSDFPAVKAIVERLKAERAAEKAKKAEADASDADAEDLLNLLS